MPHRRNLDSLQATLEGAGVVPVTTEDGAIGVVINPTALAALRQAALTCGSASSHDPSGSSA